MTSIPIYKTQTVPTATPAALTGGKRLRGFVLHGGSTDSSVQFKDAITDTGTVLFSIACLANTSTEVDFSNFGGINFSTGIYCKPAGTGAICYAWYE